MLTEKVKVFTENRNKNRKLCGWILSSALFFVLLLLYQNKASYYDSASYWSMAASFMAEDGFSINPKDAVANFSIRGYVFPFILFVLRGFWQLGWGGYWFLLSLLYGFFFAVVCADFFEILFDIKVSAIKRVVPTVCIILFWKSLIYYPLADLMSVGLEVMGLYLLIKIKKSNKWNSNIKAIIKTVAMAVGAGMLLYAAYNSRPVYQYTMYLALLLLFIEPKKLFKNRLAVNSVAAVCMLLGMILVAVPQVKINSENMGISSWKVPLQLNTMYGDTGELLFQGLGLLRYETTISDEVESPSMYSHDVTASAIFSEMQIEEKSIGNYIKVWLKYPFECIGIYFGHLINALDVRFSDVYISDISETNYIYVFASLVLVYIVLLLGKQQICDKKINGKSMWKSGVWMILWNLPTAIAMINNIEPRYFIGTWIFFYCLIAFCVDYKRFFREVGEHPVMYTVGFVVLVAICFNIWDTTYANMTYAERIFAR